MTRCHTCSRPVGLADQHLFDQTHVYCGEHCPACKPAVCAVDGCDLLAMTRGWCQKHYTRWRRHGDPGHTYVHPVTGHRSCRACHRMREAERGHRRGTPRRWALRGAGG